MLLQFRGDSDFGVHWVNERFCSRLLLPKWSLVTLEALVKGSTLALEACRLAQGSWSSGRHAGVRMCQSATGCRGEGGCGLRESATSLVLYEHLSCSHVQTAVLELDSHFHVGHPPGRASGH